MEETKNINIDPSQLEKILSVMRFVNNMSNMSSNDSNEKTPSESVDEVLLHENEIVEKMDSETALARVKSAIPFLDMPYQKTIGYMLKLMEIQRLMTTFRTMSVSGENNSVVKRRLLMAIKPQLDMRKQKMVDMFVKVMEIGDIMEGFGINE